MIDITTMQTYPTSEVLTNEVAEILTENGLLKNILIGSLLIGATIGIYKFYKNQYEKDKRTN